MTQVKRWVNLFDIMALFNYLHVRLMVGSAENPPPRDLVQASARRVPSECCQASAGLFGKEPSECQVSAGLFEEETRWHRTPDQEFVV